MKVDFSKLQMTDIENRVVENAALHKTIANTLWHNAKNLDLVEIAMVINRGEEVDLNKKDLLEIEALIKDSKNGIFAFAQKQITDFIEEARDKDAKEKNKKNKKEKKQ